MRTAFHHQICAKKHDSKATGIDEGLTRISNKEGWDGAR